MLAPETRTLLLEALRPPTGSSLSRAIALTFTLDLESLLVAPLAFAIRGSRETDDPIAIMEAVRRCANRIHVFCQEGQIAVPSVDSALLSFVEPMVHPVHRPRPGRLFHPKVWLLRYINDTTGEASLRLLVLSRNLTNDRSWDVCLRLDGVVGTRRDAENRPLADLIRYTSQKVVTPLTVERREAVDGLLEDVRRAEWEKPEGASEVRFYALGIPGARQPDFDGTRHLVMSPFCTVNGLYRCAPSYRMTLVGRQEELDRIPAEELNGEGIEVLVISELAGIPADDRHDILSGLHAKVYVVEKGHEARLLLGSANATDAAFGGNVELLVELVGKRSQLGIDATVGVGSPLRGILEPYERRAPVEVDDEPLLLLDLVRDVAAVPLVATVHSAGDRYDIQLTSDVDLPESGQVRLTAQLHTRRGEVRELAPGHCVDVTFTDLALVEVTPFVIITAEGRSARERTVVLAQLVGDPTDRLDHIIAQQIDTPEKFMRFLLLMLGFGADGFPVAALGGNGDPAIWNPTSTGVFEILLNALADRPHQLDSLADLVTRIERAGKGEQLLPPGFSHLWRLVDQAREGVTA